jgi:hypothetical protein
MQIDTMSKILSVAVQRFFQDPDAHRSFSRQGRRLQDDTV